MNIVQSGFAWADIQLVDEQDKLYSDLQRLIGSPLNEDEKIAFRGCRNIPEVFDRILNNRIFSRFIVGDTAIGSLCEMYIAMRAEAFWRPSEAWDVVGLLHGIYPKAYTIQVRHSKKWAAHQWKFSTIDHSGEQRYDMLACVGYLKPPEKIEPMGSMSHDLHPTNTEIFLIPVGDITTKSVQINRIANDMYARGQNKYWEYNIRNHDNIKAAVERVANGLPVHVNMQLAMFDIEM